MPPRIHRKSVIAIIIIGFFTVMTWLPVRPALSDAPSAIDPGDAWQTITVKKTFDNASFDYQIKLHAQRNGYRVYQIKYPSPIKTPLEQNNTVPAEYYLPDGILPGDCPNFRAAKMGLSPSARAPLAASPPVQSSENGTAPLPLPSPRRPAVICLHILDGNDVLTDLVCSVLAQRGVPAIMFRLPYYGERGLPGGPEALAKDPKLFAGALAQAGQDMARTIDLLASRPEVDPNQIGLTGISLGGIVAATAAGDQPRINRAAFVLAGGDLMKIIHHARETRPLSEMIQKLPPADRADIEDKIARVDPLRSAPALKDKVRQGKVMMINAAEDEVIPRASTEKLAAAMEMGDRVLWLQGLGHYTSMAELPRVLKTIADFFAQDLPPGVKPPIIKNQDTPMHTLSGVLQQVATILDTKPDPGKCHIVDLEVTVIPTGQNPQKGRFRLVLGDKGKFAFYCKLPVGTEISVGQNDHPWMATGAKEVIEGTENPGQSLKDPQELIGPKRAALMRMLAGVLNSIALEPDVLERLIVAKDDSVNDGLRIIQISAREKIPGSGRLMLVPIGNTPQNLSFNIAGIEGSVKFAEWKINAPAQDVLFQPLANLPRRQVKQSFLYTLFTTSLRFALGTVE